MGDDKPMNLLLHPDPEFCDQLLSSLGTPASLASVDEDGGFSLVALNRLCRTYFGMQPLSGITKLNLENIHRLTGSTLPETQAYLDRLLHNYRRTVAQRGPLTTETDYLTLEHETRWSRNVLTPILENGKPVRLIVTFVDITELKRTQEALERSLTSLVGGLVEYCVSCQRVQDGSGEWLTITRYMASRGDREFSHGICHKCVKKFGMGDPA